MSSLPTQQAEDMTDVIIRAAERWDDVKLMAELVAVDPKGLGGAILEGGACPAQARWVSYFSALQKSKPIIVPGTADEERILGGVDLLETLAAGKPVVRPGLLSQDLDGGVIVRAAEQLSPPVLSAIASAMDAGNCTGGVVFLADASEGACLSGALLDRVAFIIPLSGLPLASLDDDTPDIRTIRTAARRVADVSIDDDTVGALGQACLSTGSISLRIQMFCVRAAKAIAALDGRDSVTSSDASLAAKLILAPRAVAQADAPANDEAEQQTDQDTDQNKNSEQQSAGENPPPESDSESAPGELEEAILDAVRSGAVSLELASPPSPRQQRSSRAGGKAGQASLSRQEGRPIGSEPGDPRRGGRLDILATLRAAAPWQRLRPPPAAGSLVRIYPSDLRIRRYAHKAGSSVIFVVDASGSAAMHRLAEAKGAVEALLGECYSRRDTVSLITFRGQTADRTLPPSRSLTRARRAMAGLPGGGGTPLASALQLAAETALTEEQEGRTPLIVLLSDGQGNIDLAGEPGRAKGNEDAQKVATTIAAHQIQTLFFDTSPRTNDRARALSEAMNATYLALPFADQAVLSAAIQQERSVLKQGAGR